MTRPETDADQLRRQAATRPGDPVVRARLATVTDGEEAAQVAQEAVRLARACLDAGVIAPAREAAETLIGWAPDVGAHAALIIDTALRSGEREGLVQAGAVAARWVAREPSSADARLRAALVAVASGDTKGVRTWLAPVLETSIEARLLDAQAQLASGDPRGALDGLRVGGADAGDPDLLEVAGVAWLELGDPGRALDLFALALARAPQRASIGYNMAVAFARSGSLGAAIGACDTALAWVAESGDQARLEALRDALRARLTAGLAQDDASA